MMRIKNILLCILLGLVFSGNSHNVPAAAAAASQEDCSECVCEEFPIDLWIRISNDDENFGNLMHLDMSRGWSGADMFNVYISVIDLLSGEPVMLIFPLNDWFHMDYTIPFPPEPKEEEEFDLDEYLKKNKGKGTQIKATIK